METIIEQYYVDNFYPNTDELYKILKKDNISVTKSIVKEYLDKKDEEQIQPLLNCSLYWALKSAFTFLGDSIEDPPLNGINRLLIDEDKSCALCPYWSNNGEGADDDFVPNLLRVDLNERESLGV